MSILKTTIIALFLAGSFSLAQPNCNQNEDLQWIRDWNRDQQITTLAESMAMSSDQIATLTTVKAMADDIKAGAEAARDAHQAEVAVTAAEIRTNIEVTGEFSEADQAALDALREAGRTLRQDNRTQMQDALSALEGLLTDEQIDTMREWAQSNRQNRGGEGEARGGNRGGQDGFRAENRGGNRGNRGAKAARVLLSDAFLAYYE